MQRSKGQITFAAQILCSKYFCSISVTQNSTSTGKIALLSGIRCILLYVGQLQPSGVWFHQGFWFNSEVYRHLIMCSASWNFIFSISTSSAPPESEYLQTGINIITERIWLDRTTADSRKHSSFIQTNGQNKLFCKIVNMLTILKSYQKGETFKLKRPSIAHAIIYQDASTSVLKEVICYVTFSQWKSA